MTDNPFRNLPVGQRRPATRRPCSALAERARPRADRRRRPRTNWPSCAARCGQGEALDGAGRRRRRRRPRRRRGWRANCARSCGRSSTPPASSCTPTSAGRRIAEEAAQAAYEAARGYLNLELDLETGKRSSRQDAIREWVCRLTGAESATAVNNNAAATVIVLRALCQGKEVIISRGQLIEIGGSFRIPEIMAVSGAILREVGTTNITRLADYERAIGPNTGALLQVHTQQLSHLRLHRSRSPLADLVALGKKHSLPVIDDIGSGALLDFAPLRLHRRAGGAATASRPGPTWCCSAATSCWAARRPASSPAARSGSRRSKKTR